MKFGITVSATVLCKTSAFVLSVGEMICHEAVAGHFHGT